MNVRNCRKCGKIFNYVSGAPICPACKEENEVKFQEVKKFIRDNHIASIPEISQKCDVEPTQINQWVREERLEFADESPVGIGCEICGVTIKTGRFCEKCKAEMAQTLASAGRKPKAPIQTQKRDISENPKMRFLDR